MKRLSQPNGPQASPFATGGGGFEYADSVAALVLAAMLTGKSPFGDDIGPVSRVGWETKDLGWGTFDDLHLNCGKDGARQVAISCKAARYVTRSGWPAEVRDGAWQLWNHAAGSFRRDADLLAVVTGALAQDVAGAWAMVRREADASIADPARFINRYASLSDSNVARALVNSIAPPSSTGQTPGIEDHAAMIRHLRLWHMDFLESNSRDAARAVDYCQEALADGERGVAKRLFEKLRSIAADHRISGGTLDLNGLLKLVVPELRLKSSPDLEAAWLQLSAHSNELVSAVKDSVGGVLCLARLAEMADLTAAANAGHVAVIIGESGCGKSALAKRLAAKHVRILWLSASDLEAQTLGLVGARLGLSLPIEQLIEKNTAPSPVLVFDSAERLSPTARRNAARITALAVKAAQPWLVLFTAHEDAQAPLARELAREQIPSESIHYCPVTLPTTAIVGAVLPDLPVGIAAQPTKSLLKALRNLKALDLVASSPAGQILTGFPDLAQAVWSELIGTEDNHARASLLKRLASLDAQSLAGGVPSSALPSPDENRVAQTLVNTGLLAYHRQRYFFRHDLLGDWARLLLLIEAGDAVQANLRDVSSNVRWAPALRLFAEWLAQGHESDQQRLVSLLTGDIAEAGFTTLLEGLLRSPDCGAALDRVVSEALRSRPQAVPVILKTFARVASRPADITSMLRADHPQGAAMRAIFRSPLPELWSSTIGAFDKHRQALAALSPWALAEVARTWLSDEATTSRPEFADISVACSRLAVEAAREVQSLQAIRYLGSDDDDKLVFEAMLLAANWLPDDVAQTALELCHRRPDPPRVVERVEAEKKRVAEEMAKRVAQLAKKGTRPQGSFSIPPTPQPRRPRLVDGPMKCLRDPLRNAVLSIGAMVRLMMQRPDAAHEVLLACCLEDPDTADPLYDRYPHGPDTGTIDKMDWYPPTYLNGPWFTLLLRVPREGLKAVLRLVDIGTAEWERLHMPRRAKPDEAARIKQITTISLEIDGARREYRGGPDVFGWYRDDGRAGNVVASALMALEQWLYQCLDRGEPIDWAIRDMLTSSSSVATLGVLAALARRETRLINGALLPLLASWRLLVWDDQMSIHTHTRSKLPELDFLGLSELKTWKDDHSEQWSKLPHRSARLPVLIATKLALGEGDILAAVAMARTEWRNELDSGESDDPRHLTLLIAILDPANLSIRRQGNEVTLEVKWPPEMASEHEEQSKQTQPGILAFHLRRTARALLDKGSEINEELAEHLWAAVSTLPLEPLEDETETQSLVSARTAVAAVFETLAASWLTRFADRQVWCEEVVLPAKPAGKPDALRGVSIWREHTASFVGEWALARLAHGDQRPHIRALLAENLVGSEPVVTGQILASALRQSARLTDELGRLFNLFWFWSALHCLRPIWGLEKDWQLRVAERRRQSLIARFVTRAISNEPHPWDDLRLRAARLYERHDRQRRAHSRSWLEEKHESVDRSPLPTDWAAYDEHGFDWGILDRVIGQLPVITAPSKRPDMAALVEFDRRLFDLVYFGLEHARERHNGRDELPNQFEHLALSRMCLYIAEHEDDAAALAPWSRMASVLAGRPEWCSSFFDAWFRQSRTEGPQAERVHRRWKAMIALAGSLPQWEPAAAQWSHDRITVWSALLGVSDRGSGLGTKADRPVLRDLLPIYATWRQRTLTHHWRLRTFCNFLQTPGAFDLRVPALAWVSTAIGQLAPYFGQDGEALDEVANYCIATWSEQRDTILESGAAQAALVSLVQFLSKMQIRHIADTREDLESTLGGVFSATASPPSSRKSK